MYIFIYIYWCVYIYKDIYLVILWFFVLFVKQPTKCIIMKLDSSQIGNWQAFTKFGEKSSIIMSTARKRINPQKLGNEKAPRHIQDT